MKFTLNWLKEYIDLDLPVDIVADKLTMLGLEVDNVVELYRITSYNVCYTKLLRGD